MMHFCTETISALFSCCPSQLRFTPFRRSRHIFIPILGLRIGLRLLARRKALLEVVDDVVDVLGADADADQVLSDAGFALLLVRELLVRGGPGVDGEGLRVADAARTLVKGTGNSEGGTG